MRPDITLEDLKAYRALRAELDMLYKQRAELYYPYRSPNGKQTEGGFGGSPSDPTASAYAKLEAVDKLLSDKLCEASNKIYAITLWVDDLDDVELRAIIRGHYLNGMSWREVCKKVYGYDTNDGNPCRMRVMRYFKQ